MRVGTVLRPRRRTVLLALVLLGAALLVLAGREPHSVRTAPVSTAATGCDGGATASAGTMRLGGRLRTYRLCLPPKRSGPAPLVVALHGMGGSGAQMLTSTRLGAQGIAVVAPDGLDGLWNDGRLGPAGPDDDAFVLALVRRLVAGGIADPRRVTLTGFSNGADFALALSSRHPDVFAATVAVSGYLLADNGSARPRKPGTTFLVCGTADPIQPCTGRTARGRLRPALLSADATAAAFARASAADRVTRREQPGLVTVRHSSTRTAGSVELLEVTGVGHVWPTAALDATGLVVAVARAAHVGAPTAVSS